MEKDDEVEGQGNSYTATFWQYSDRLGRRWNIDPVIKQSISRYVAFSNNPIIMIDPNGDDDYYNERGVYLYTDTKTSNDIKLITQENFDRIQNKYSAEMNDSDSSNLNLIRELETSSRKVTIKISGEQFKSMLDDSNLNSNDFTSRKENLDKHPKRRKEQAALIVLDIEKAEIRLERQDDSNNTHDNCKLINGWGSSKDGKAVWYGPTEDNPNYSVNENIIIIGIVHTHPVKSNNENGFTLFIPSFHTDDKKAATSWKVPNFQIYPLLINQVDVVTPNTEIGKKEPDVDNVTTTKKLIKGEYNIGKKALEYTGGKNKNLKQ